MAKARKQVAKWDEELAKYAQKAAEMEMNSGGGQMFSTKSGVLSWQGMPLPNNEMAVIILDHIFETVYYEGEYDPDYPQNPVAFALGRDEKTLAWHENSDPEFAGELCKDSEVCQWGSAEKGKGKAAKECRRLAMIPAGQWDRNGELEIFDDPEHYLKAEVGFMKLPVMSVKGFASFVKQVANVMKRPPFGIVARVYLEPDAKSQFRVLFEVLETVPDNLMGVIMQRREETMSLIDFPYQMDGEQEEPKPAPKTRAKRKAPAKKASVTKSRAKRGKY